METKQVAQIPGLFGGEVLRIVLLQFRCVQARCLPGGEHDSGSPERSHAGWAGALSGDRSLRVGPESQPWCPQAALPVLAPRPHPTASQICTVSRDGDHAKPLYQIIVESSPMVYSHQNIPCY